MSESGYVTDPLIILGVLIFLVGILIFCFGKKWFILRSFFGDRSMFSQIFWGLIISLIGLILLYISGVFTK